MPLNSLERFPLLRDGYTKLDRRNLNRLGQQALVPADIERGRHATGF